MRNILLAAILSGTTLPANAQLETVPQRTQAWAQKQVENFVAFWSRDEDVNRGSTTHSQPSLRAERSNPGTHGA